jgi:hypothetical protein
MKTGETSASWPGLARFAMDFGERPEVISPSGVFPCLCPSDSAAYLSAAAPFAFPADAPPVVLLDVPQGDPPDVRLALVESLAGLQVARLALVAL